MNARARQLRKGMTDTERALWRRLRERQIQGCKFRRQAPVGRYIVDFACFPRKVIIELDGGQHATRTPQDERRTAWLRSQGFTILRFWDNEVLKNLEGVLEAIAAHLPPTSILPHKGGGEPPESTRSRHGS